MDGHDRPIADGLNHLENMNFKVTLLYHLISLEISYCKWSITWDEIEEVSFIIDIDKIAQLVIDNCLRNANKTKGKQRNHIMKKNACLSHIRGSQEKEERKTFLLSRLN